MLRKLYIFSIILTFTFSNCSTAQNVKKNTESNNHIITLVKGVFSGIDQNRYSIKDSIASNLWRDSRKVSDLINSGQFSWIRNFNIKTEKDVIQFNKVFSKKEFSSMKNQILNNKFKKWSELIDFKKYRTSLSTSKKEILRYSIPTFNDSKTMSVIYIEFPYSGELRVYQKQENGTWKYIANSLVWRAD